MSTNACAQGRSSTLLLFLVDFQRDTPGPPALAGKVGVTQQSISYWVKKGQVPAEMALAVERATGVPRHVLRPDLFDAPLDDAARDAVEQTGEAA